MEQIVFPVPGICQFLTEETKHRLFTTTEQDEQGSKVSDFFDQSSFLHNEMEWQRKLRSEDPHGGGWARLGLELLSGAPCAPPLPAGGGCTPPHPWEGSSQRFPPEVGPGACAGAGGPCGWVDNMKERPRSHRPAATPLPQACH